MFRFESACDVWVGVPQGCLSPGEKRVYFSLGVHSFLDDDADDVDVHPARRRAAHAQSVCFMCVFGSSLRCTVCVDGRKDGGGEGWDLNNYCCVCVPQERPHCTRYAPCISQATTKRDD